MERAINVLSVSGAIGNCALMKVDIVCLAAYSNFFECLTCQFLYC